ncbi:MAG: hypothetical protein ACRDIF_03025 [Actinomycetota bacterium]
MALKETDVPTMMMRVQSALAKQARAPVSMGPLVIEGQGYDEFGIAALRSPADLVTDFQAGSARPLIGRAVGLVKRVLRRSLRWYIVPLAAQQSRFNHALLDVLERLRAAIERLETEVALIQPPDKYGSDDRRDPREAAPEQ